MASNEGKDMYSIFSNWKFTLSVTLGKEGLYHCQLHLQYRLLKRQYGGLQGRDSSWDELSYISVGAMDTTTDGQSEFTCHISAAKGAIRSFCNSTA